MYFQLSFYHLCLIYNMCFCYNCFGVPPLSGLVRLGFAVPGLMFSLGCTRFIDLAEGGQDFEKNQGFDIYGLGLIFERFVKQTSMFGVHDCHAGFRIWGLRGDC